MITKNKLDLLTMTREQNKIELQMINGPPELLVYKLLITKTSEFTGFTIKERGRSGSETRNRDKP